MKLGRDAYYAMQDMPIESALEFLCGQLSINTTLEDATEGIMAFMQKRDPQWKHK
jgi:enoyl-CoA hydratase/carnithine racemase